MAKHEYTSRIVEVGPPVEPYWVPQGPGKTATEYTCSRCGDTFIIQHFLFGYHDEKLKEDCPVGD